MLTRGSATRAGFGGDLSRLDGQAADPGPVGHQGPRLRRGRAPAGGHGGHRGPTGVRLRGGLRPHRRGRLAATSPTAAHRSTASGPRRNWDLRWMAAFRRLLVAGPLRRRPLPPAVHGGAGPAGRGTLPGAGRPAIVYTEHSLWNKAASLVRRSTGPPSGSTESLIAVSQAAYEALPGPSGPGPASWSTASICPTAGAMVARRPEVRGQDPGRARRARRRRPGRDRGQPATGEGLRRPARRRPRWWASGPPRPVRGRRSGRPRGRSWRSGAGSSASATGSGSSASADDVLRPADRGRHLRAPLPPGGPAGRA